MARWAFCLALLLCPVLHGAALDSVRFPFASRDGQSNFDRTESGVRLRDATPPGMGLHMTSREDREAAPSFAASINGRQVPDSAAVAAAQTMLSAPVPPSECSVDLTDAAPPPPAPEVEFNPAPDNEPAAAWLAGLVLAAGWVVRSRLEFQPRQSGTDALAFAS